MLSKALWKKDYKQAKLLLWLMPAAGFLFLVFNRMNKLIILELGTIERQLQLMREHPENATIYSFGYEFTHYRVALAVLALGVAVLLIGMERRGLHQDFTFSLPFKRTQIYLNKWLLGFVFILGSVLFTNLLDMTVILLSPFHDYFTLSVHVREIFRSTLILTAWYTIVLFAGTFTGGALTQILLSLVACILPMALMSMIGSFFSVHGPGYREVLNPVIRRYLEYLNPLSLVTGGYSTASLYLFVICMVYILFFLGAGLYAYSKNKPENNGKVILFPGLEPYFLWFIVGCGALFAGLVAKDFNTVAFYPYQKSGVFNYYFGFFLGGAIVYFLLRFLLKRRFKFI
ncbi:ABC transporter permease subunit [Paenibacillus sp. UNC499MF]|uniref:ABC transporter permease subunit n=1 Tax=Paenibacillus sp. UNC499MF TaxID=1502751 RepID=UPI00089FBA61|nr:ABC transporter permease subunit [Paenibacillus sp. UNC499MF]SEG39003.1 hypothetical protein SAMN02799616_02817 [Paenibacillus sp. UNC499MF]